MGLISGAANAYFTYKFLRLLTQDWKDTDAYKLGIVDEDGKALKKIRDLDTQDEKDAYSVFNRLVFNLKRIIGKLPFGKTRLASYAAALFLIKEHQGVDNEAIENILAEMEIDFTDDILESTDEWFIREGRLGQGTYALTNDIASPATLEIAGRKGSKVISEGSEPYGEIMGLPVYKVKHVTTGQILFVTSKDIKR